MIFALIFSLMIEVIISLYLILSTQNLPIPKDNTVSDETKLL